MTKFKKNREYFQKTEHTVNLVRTEINAGLKILNAIHQPIVTIFGSHRVRSSNRNYQHARRLAQQFGKQGWAVMTGGGPGIMAAANAGAMQAKTASIGFPAKLLKRERVRLDLFTHYRPLHFIFVRRFVLSIKSDALVFYPGGFGTLNELFEFLVLMQVGIVDRVPMICVDKKYWQGLFEWIDRYPKRLKMFTRPQSIRLVRFADQPKEILRLAGV